VDELAGNDGAPLTFELLRDKDGSALLKLGGELDISNVEALELAARPILESNPARMVIDVGQLRFADSSALALWVRWAAMVPEIEIRGASPLLRRVIMAMGLAQMLHVTP
jgi:anti-anti-sigma factor